MENLKILKSFFDEPNRKFSIRELSRILRINHTSIRQYLNRLVNEEFLHFKKEGVYSFYQLNLNKKTLNLKKYYNLENLRESFIIEDIEKTYDYPIVILFGSYASGIDNIHSDIDICIISNTNKEFSLKKYDKILNRTVSIHKFSKDLWKNMRKTNKELVNSICNGIVLSGELEVYD